MKILQKANTASWWLNRKIDCECGFSAIIEENDVESNVDGKFEVMSSMIGFRCECSRLVTIHQEGQWN